MRFKVDENLPDDLAENLRRVGFEAETVSAEGLQGAGDALVAEAAKNENRILITLDTDFGNIRAYPPEDFAGIVVLRPTAQDRASVLALANRLLILFRERTPDRDLWIVEPDRIRFRRSEF